MLNPGVREDEANSTRRRLRGKQRNPEEVTRRNQDHEEARVENRQRISEELTMRDKGREKMRLRSKQNVPDVWMMKECETVDVQPQEERNEKASSSATGVAVREQQHQMPSHVQIFIPDRGRRIKIVPPKPPREKKKRPSSKEEAQGNARFVDWCSRVRITGTYATRLRGRFGAREYRSDQQKSTRTERDAMRYACRYCHHKSPDGKTAQTHDTACSRRRLKSGLPVNG